MNDNIRNYGVDLFPPLIYKFQYDFDFDEGLRNRIDAHINSTNQNSALEYGQAWASVYSTTNYPHVWQRFVPLMEFLDERLKQIFADNRLLTDEYSIVNSWYIKHLRGGITAEHHHNQTDFSVVCYLNCPPNSGNIVFMDPLEYHKSRYPISTFEPKKFREYEFEVHTNDVLIFPGWLRHSTTANETDEGRYIMAIDIACSV